MYLWPADQERQSIEGGRGAVSQLSRNAKHRPISDLSAAATLGNITCAKFAVQRKLN